MEEKKNSTSPKKIDWKKYLNKKYYKIYIASFLLVALVSGLVVGLVIAGGNDQSGGHRKPPSQNNGQQTTPSSGGNGPENPDAHIEMPELVDMNGYVYKAYVRAHAGDTLDEQIEHGNNFYKCIDFWIDEANREQDAISFAVYNRNSRIESDYNCKIRQVASNGSQIEHLTSAYANGDGYDLTIISARPAAQAATRNLLRNLTYLPYTDLTHPSFDPNSVEELSVEDKLYFVSGDMNVSTLEVAGLSLANMEFYADLADSIVELFEGDLSYANLYSLITSKKWTMETMMKIATLANLDNDETDGDLSVIDKGDTIGYHQYLNSTLWYFYASGGRITTKNDNGVPELTIKTARNQDLVNYIYDHLNSTISVPWIPNSYSAILDQNFLTGDVLFMDCSLYEIRMEIYPRAEFEYGILPCPIYEEGDDYHSVIFFNNWAHLWAIPCMNENLENAQRMLQIMAVYSSLSDSTMYAYYDRTIYLNAAPDNGSREVMDTIRQSMVYDIALLYDWGGLETMLNDLDTATSNPYAAAVNGIETRINPLIQSTVEKLRDPTLGME